jgi:glycogen(starch) synthase
MDAAESFSMGATPFCAQQVMGGILGIGSPASSAETIMKLGSINRVLFWSERFWPAIGGVGISASRLLPALRERGYEFVVVTSRDSIDLPEEDWYRGISVYRFPFWSALASGNVIQIMELRGRVAQLKRMFSPDLIHIGFLGASVAFHLHTIDAHPSPSLVSMDSFLPDRELGRDSLAGRILRSADWVTCVSAARLAEARNRVSEIGERSSLVYNGREVPPCEPQPLPFEAPRLLCLGRLDPIKGFDIALTAFGSVVARFPKARLVIAGDGAQRAALEQYASQLNLQGSVDFVGWVPPDDVPALMNRSTVVVIPSRNEGLPNVAKEAALMRRPIVATNVGGIPEAVVHGQSGLLVDKDDADALAKAITFLLEHPKAAAKMGSFGRSYTEQVFSLERYIDAYDTLYRKLIGVAEQGAQVCRENSVSLGSLSPEFPSPRPK